MSRELLSKIPPGKAHDRTEIRLLLEEGRHLWLIRNPAKALNLFNQAWTLASTSGENFFAIDAAIMLSLCQPKKFQNEWLQKALSLAEESPDEQAKLWLTQLYILNGWHFFDFRRFEEAYDNFIKALDRPRGNGETSNVHMIRWCVGRALRGLNRITEALDIQTQIKTDLSILGQTNGHVFLEIAECLQLLQRVEEAKSFFELAYKDLSTDPWYSDNNGTELKRMQFLYKLR
jgi:tetratricopeptide (TPR) repeat protein